MTNRATMMSTLQVLKIQREKLSHRRWLRVAWMNRILAALGGRWQTAPMRRALNEYVRGFDSVIDLACGTDTLLSSIANSATKQVFAVANDLDFEALRYMRRKDKSLALVNADLRTLPFRGPLGCAIAKCVLHHANSDEAIADFLESLSLVAKRLLIVEIEDPFRSNWRAFFWHVLWYRLVLADDGGRFFTGPELESLIRIAYPAASIRFERISALKGVYLVARIDF
jgi:SAM-dependent methyltransferase